MGLSNRVVLHMKNLNCDSYIIQIGANDILLPYLLNHSEGWKNRVGGLIKRKRGGKTMIRKPKDNESNDSIRLMYMSGANMFSYFLIEREPEIYKYIMVFYTKPDVLFSRENVLVKIENEKVCGLLLSVPARDMKQMDKNMMKYGRELFKVSGFINSIKMMFRSRLQKYLAILNTDDEYYISNLAVFEDFRGKGFGVELLKKAEELAREKGYNKLSLAVEFYNKEAKRIYEKFGFYETDKVEFPKKYHKYSIDGFYKMVKVLN